MLRVLAKTLGDILYYKLPTHVAYFADITKLDIVKTLGRTPARDLT